MARFDEPWNRSQGPLMVAPPRIHRGRIYAPVREAERISDGRRLDAGGIPFSTLPHPVRLKGRWSFRGEEFPNGLVGRITDSHSGFVEVYFKGRGVFFFSENDVLRE